MEDYSQPGPIPTLPQIPYLLPILSSGHYLSGNASHGIQRFYNTMGSERGHPGSGVMAQKWWR